MRMIKLTSAVNGTALYINVKHLIAFWEQDGVTRFTLTNEDNFGRVKETPDEIIHLIKMADERK